MRVAVTGGAGYIGACLSAQLLADGHSVVVVDRLLHGQSEVAAALEETGAVLYRRDIADDVALGAALAGADAVVHLAAIVGDPACARDPEVAATVNVAGSRAVVDAARRAGAARFIFASTCSNYGRLPDPTVPIDETGDLRPVSLYAEQKVEIERALLNGTAEDPASASDAMSVTCLRFATVYGVAPRMRFDLTVNEFTRDLWAGKSLEVFGERFWRPYIHVADAAAAIRTVLDAPEDVVRGEVFNAGHSDENYRKVDLVEHIVAHLGRGEVSYVERTEDPRDYKVSFAKIATALGFVPERTVDDGIVEIADALDAGRFGDPFNPRHAN